MSLRNFLQEMHREALGIICMDLLDKVKTKVELRAEETTAFCDRHLIDTSGTLQGSRFQSLGFDITVVRQLAPPLRGVDTRGIETVHIYVEMGEEPLRHIHQTNYPDSSWLEFPLTGRAAALATPHRMYA